MMQPPCLALKRAGFEGLRCLIKPIPSSLSFPLCPLSLSPVPSRARAALDEELG